MDDFYAHQKKFLQQNPSKALLCWDTGTGKTRTGIEWAKINFATKDLAIVPKALKKNWERQIKLYQGNLMHDWIILTKEEFRANWDKVPYCENVIVDEGHHFAGRKSEMSASLRSYLKKWNTPHVLILTATPYRSSPWDIFVLAAHLGRHWSPGRFLDRFFEQRYVGREIERFGKKQKRSVWAVKDGIQNDMAALVGKIGSVVRIDECADIPEQVDETEIFELNDIQKKKKLEIYDPNPMVRYTKYHEIENGFLKGDEYVPDEFLPSDKKDRILELCKENDKIIIVARYHGQMRALTAMLKELDTPVYEISGRVKNRDEVVQEAEAAEKAIVIVQAACSEGYELPSFPLMVFASMDFSYVNYKQMRGRILRLNKLKKNVYLHLVTNGVDASVYTAIMKKQDFNIAIYSADYDSKTEEEILGERLPNKVQPMAETHPLQDGGVRTEGD